ncbi:hypothetical protein NE237_028974 [Protea cynaroides]|uniref:F-box associated beta-propeller type 3 domain-containing protein n=1 Tax=Protea cynaroides TaxID=273540 RepID=A0A9Q0JUN2_9MAGN|nr:hypothetical protein NE237_028974 [Protea cynaroides]
MPIAGGSRPPVVGSRARMADLGLVVGLDYSRNIDYPFGINKVSGNDDMIRVFVEPSITYLEWRRLCKVGYQTLNSVDDGFWDDSHGCYITLMDLYEEKFYEIQVPEPYNHVGSVRLWTMLEIDGCLSIGIPSIEGNAWNIWILKDVKSGNWVRQLSIVAWIGSDMKRQLLMPIGSLRNGKVIVLVNFETVKLYSYNVESQQLTETKIKLNSVFPSCKAHVNSLQFL